MVVKINSNKRLTFNTFTAGADRKWVWVLSTGTFDEWRQRTRQDRHYQIVKSLETNIWRRYLGDASHEERVSEAIPEHKQRGAGAKGYF